MLAYIIGLSMIATLFVATLMFILGAFLIKGMTERQRGNAFFIGLVCLFLAFLMAKLVGV
jgi:hypothetical protein